MSGRGEVSYMGGGNVQGGTVRGEMSGGKCPGGNVLHPADHRNLAARTVTLPTAPPRQATTKALLADHLFLIFF